jgi:Tol biopolymer transport system component
MRSTPQFRDYRILCSRLEQGAWTNPEPVSFARPLPVTDADPCLSPDGTRLYFVSNRRPDGSVGEDLDIWFVTRRGDGPWGEPQHLPEPVNSAGSELLPRVLADGRLVFGSDRPGGHGQSDIYLATPQPEGSWRVQNFDAPVSTAANEYEAEISQDGKSLVVVADRGDRSHLYRFQLLNDGRWRELGRIPARLDVFQVGPLFSPQADRLLFAQADGTRSGEFFLIDLAPAPHLSWPPGDSGADHPSNAQQTPQALH